MKKFCASCAWFKVDSAIQRAPVIKGGTALQGGFCCFNPPTVLLVNVQHPVSHQISAQMTPARPAVFADDFCRHHSANEFNRLEYDPAKHPDFGFNRPPTLAEAKAFAANLPAGIAIMAEQQDSVTGSDAPGT